MQGQTNLTDALIDSIKPTLELLIKREVNFQLKKNIDEIRGKSFNTKQYLTVREAAEEFGPSEAFYRKRILDETIPFRRAGRRIIFDRQELEEFFSGIKK